ncbi:hypothetical protein SEA_MOSSY_39 [Gordonia phage Mossy]|nr:hypothetical protein SEA_MOSSY_39 [Gordonia phage Mossy]
MPYNEPLRKDTPMNENEQIVVGGVVFLAGVAVVAVDYATKRNALRKKFAEDMRKLEALKAALLETKAGLLAETEIAKRINDGCYKSETEMLKAYDAELKFQKIAVRFDS